nr:MAG TPA: hypothetical protein [Caudoviricetes sp.]
MVHTFLEVRRIITPLRLVHGTRLIQLAILST